MKKSVFICSVIVPGLSLLVVAAGCSKSAPSPSSDAGHGHSHAKPSSSPHGGTPVQVGAHDFHLELVNDTHAGKMLAYVFDDHFEKPVSVPPTTFDLIATFGGQEHKAVFNPGDGAASPATNVSVFFATAPWLKQATEFEGLIPQITLKNETFTNITFSFPKGTLHKH